MLILRWAAIILGALLIAGFLFFRFYLIPQTKKASPEKTVEFIKDDLQIDIFYNRPSKKNRVIFGNIVPYNQVWRTGANEATTFKTNKDLNIGENVLPAGKYTLWTIPNEKEWEIIFNKKMYRWGVGARGASRKAKHDQLKIKVPVKALEEIVEMFTIELVEVNNAVNMSLTWDQIQVAVPIKY